jgi:hypothetical protein
MLLFTVTCYQVALYHCNISEETGALYHLPPPSSSSKHHGVKHSHIRSSGDEVRSSMKVAVCKRGDANGPQSACLNDGVVKKELRDDVMADVGQPFDLIICVRFLIRAFHSRVKDMLCPGGYVLYNT